MVSRRELESGLVMRVKLSAAAKLAGESLVTFGRKIKAGALPAIIDPTSGRIFIPAEKLLAYLNGTQYAHDHHNKDAIQRMEKARGAKTATRRGK